MSTSSAEPKKLSLDNAIFYGDALKVIPKLPNNHFRCLLTDPPYGINYVSDWNNGSNARPIRGDTPGAHQLLDEVLCLAKPKLKGSAAVYVFTSWKTLNTTLKAVSAHFRVKNVLVWVKDSWGMGDLNGSYAGQYEMIIYAVKGKPALSPPRSPDVLSYPRVPPMKRFHPAQKPIPLLVFLIEKSTKKGEAVLDTFAGSGSTALACLKTDRTFVCIEKSRGHYATSVERVIKHLKREGS
jgi:site-specific DNA-methyltransferase (adenine-specific)